MKLYLFQVLLIGGSTGSMLEALDVVGGDNDSPLASVGTITVSFTTNDNPLLSFMYSTSTKFLVCLLPCLLVCLLP